MYKAIKGVYKGGQIIPEEQVEVKAEKVPVIITFLQDEPEIKEAALSSSDEILFTIGERAVEGKLKDAAERHDYYLYESEA